MHPFSISETNDIKFATAAAYEAVGGVSRAAGLLEGGSSTLTKYASVDAEWRERVIRMDLAVSLDRHAGHPFLLNAYQRLVGAMSPPAPELTARAVLKLNTILDDVVREVALAIDDCRVDGAENWRSGVGSLRRNGNWRGWKRLCGETWEVNMGDQDPDGIKAVVSKVSAVLADGDDAAVSGIGVLTAAALFCVCAGMKDEDITTTFGLVLREARAADNTASGAGDGRAN